MTWRTVAPVILVLLLGCYQTYHDVEDVEADVRVDVDVVRDGDTEVHADADADGDTGEDTGVEADADVGEDADVDADADADADADVGDDGLGECTGGWFDPASGLCWQDPPHDDWMNWWDAVAYCDGLSLAGYGPGSWHLPTISELRSLIRGCPGTETGGACGVTDSCTGDGCWNYDCWECDWRGGPRTDGCYWPAGFRGECSWFWSSSSSAGSASNAWLVVFYDGSVYYADKTDAGYVRCVRRGP